MANLTEHRRWAGIPRRVGSLTSAVLISLAVLAGAPMSASAATATVRCKDPHIGNGSGKDVAYIDIQTDPPGSASVSVTGGDNVSSDVSTVSATQSLLTVRYRTPPNVNVVFTTGGSVTLSGGALAAAPDCSVLALSAIPAGPIGLAALGAGALALLAHLTIRTTRTARRTRRREIPT